ncbi:hypothetical protein JW935_21775, partial [candidate division KSB1 bacterium]|nr:hypothetical protein [candidate division KSB1 bacterium]
PAGEIDLALMVNVLHLLDDVPAFFSNMTPCLKKNGYLIVVQWDAEKMAGEMPEWDPSDRELYTMRTTLRKIYDANYEVCKIKSFYPCRPSISAGQSIIEKLIKRFEYPLEIFKSY